MIRHIAVASLTILLAGAPARAAEPGASDTDRTGPLEPGTPAPPLPAGRDPGADPGPKISESEGETRSRVVEELLGRLAKTDDAGTAKRLASAVQALWLRSGSDTVDLLTSRSIEAQREQKNEIALRLMDEAVSLKPDYAEGWNRRATLHFMEKQYDEAMSDIRETLTLQPRHFGAWLGLGRILEDFDMDKKALAAYRRALEIYPQIEGLKRQVDELSLKVEGQPI